MGVMKDIGTIQKVLAAEVENLLSWGERENAERLDMAWIRIRRIALESENRLSDEGKGTAWMNMPEAEDELPKSTIADDLKRLEKTVSFMSDHIVLLQGHLCDVEKRIERLEDGKVD